MPRRTCALPEEAMEVDSVYGNTTMNVHNALVDVHLLQAQMSKDLTKREFEQKQQDDEDILAAAPEKETVKSDRSDKARDPREALRKAKSKYETVYLEKLAKLEGSVLRLRSDVNDLDGVDFVLDHLE